MSLRSRIRGGQDYLTDRVATAAQFLTLRLIPIGSTHVGCYDSDGPGHAPRYLDVSHKNMKLLNVLLLGIGVIAVIGYISNFYSIPKLERRFYAGLSNGDYNRKIELHGWLPFVITGYFVQHADGDPPVTSEIGGIVVFAVTYCNLYGRTK